MLRPPPISKPLSISCAISKEASVLVYNLRLDSHQIYLPSLMPIGLLAWMIAALPTVYSVFLGTNLLSWGTKKEATVSRSSAEAEEKALAVTASELLWLSYVLCDLGLRFSLPSLLYCDNISATHMAVNPVFHARTKDVEIDSHFVREKVARGDLKVLYVQTDNQTTDVFTKGLSSSRFLQLRDKRMLSTLPWR